MKALSREICRICYHVNAVGFCVPDVIWHSIIPDPLKSSVVCLACFARLADEKVVAWEHDIELFPVSLATHLGFDG